MLENEGEDTGGEVVETPEPEAEPDVVEAEPEIEIVEELPQKSVGDILGELSDDDNKPAWMQGLEAALPEGASKFKLAGDPSTWPPEAQQLLYNTLQEQKANEERLEAEFKKRETYGRDLDSEKRKVAAERHATTKLWTSDKIRQFAEGLKPTGDQPDPYSPEGLQWAVNKQTADVLGQFLDVLSGEAKAQADAIAADEAKIAMDTRVEAAAAYMRLYPDDFKNDHIYGQIEELCRKSNYTIDVKDAHEFVMGRLAIQKNEQGMELARQRARNRIRPGSGKSPSAPNTPKFRDSAEEISFYNAHPDALNRDYEYVVKRGTSY